MFSDGRGQLRATHLLYRVFSEGVASAFDSVAAKAATEAVDEWEGWQPSVAAPALCRVADGPLMEIQPKHPALVITPRGGDRQFPMVNYQFEVSYTYACPTMLQTVDIPLLACQLAQEALYQAMKDTHLLTGIGWTMSSWSISELQEASLPAPLFSRTLTVNVSLQIEEDY